jgi:FkbM family methyltransferase
MKHHGQGMKNHNARALGGEYDVVGLELSENAIVLDVGACDGAFTIWALSRWPSCIVHAYEPNPQSATNWVANVMPIARGRARLTTCAVMRGVSTAQLWPGPNNSGEASCVNRWGTWREPLLVPAIDPPALPPCAFAKIDTEGAEVEILSGLVRPSHALALEWHSKSDLDAIREMFPGGHVDAYAGGETGIFKVRT